MYDPYWEFIICDKDDNEIAVCRDIKNAELICNALNNNIN